MRPEVSEAVLGSIGRTIFNWNSSAHVANEPLVHD